MLLDDEFADIIEDLVAEAGAEGISILFTSGYRSVSEQRRLFEGPLGKRGLAAAPGRSFHNYGLALDFQASPPDAIQRVGEIAEALGLRWGGRFSPPDLPHVDAGNFLTIEDARKQFRTGNLVEVA